MVEQDFLDDKRVVGTACVHSATLRLHHTGEDALGFNVRIVRDTTDAASGMQADTEPVQDLGAEDGRCALPFFPQALFRDGRVGENDVAVR